VYALREPIYYYVKTEGSLVTQGASVSNTVRMKLNVIEYYSKFYKNIYSSTSYAMKMPVIYSFLIDFASDGTAFSIFPGTKKLGKERQIIMHETKTDNVWIHQYYETILLERNLESIAFQYDLELRDVKILMYIHTFGVCENTAELEDYLGLNRFANGKQLRQTCKKRVFK